MNLGLHDKVALVTASSRGLGKAVALRLAQEGASVAICARGEGTLSESASEIETATGQTVLAIPADVSAPESATALVEATVESFGRLDILVTNAGGPPPGQFLDFTVEDWEKAGAILAMTSITVKQPLPNLVLSNSLRLGVTGLVKTLADELAPFGIRVNAICPGWTRTARVDQLLEDRAERNATTPEAEAAQLAEHIPLGRMGRPEEFAAAAAFLVSEAASYVNGVSLLVDGGMYRGTS
jgi:3-oxoacyl-[acyl-carrier protein] reductase